MSKPVPVALFAFRRPDLLLRTLDGLKESAVPLLYIFCDGPRNKEDESGVDAVRKIVAEIDWCETHVLFRDTNLGLGRSILAGVDSVFKDHDRLLVFEDDIVCVPGTYAYLVEALRQYENEKKVMSVAGWTHELLRPSTSVGQPYFDGRFACWGWGTWRRAWKGMWIPAVVLFWLCLLSLRDPYRYGEDIPDMAFRERKLGIWAVRFCLLHILRGGLCFHAPRRLTNHIGEDDRGTNVRTRGVLHSDEKILAAPEPSEWGWPVPVESPEVARLWQETNGRHDPFWQRIPWLLSKHLRGRR